MLRPPLTCICSGHPAIAGWAHLTWVLPATSALNLLPWLEDYFAAFRTVRNNAAIPISNTVTSIRTDV